MRNEIVRCADERIGAYLKEYRMNTSTKVRVASLIAAALVTFGVIGQIADYALSAHTGGAGGYRFPLT